MRSSFRPRHVNPYTLQSTSVLILTFPMGCGKVLLAHAAAAMLTTGRTEGQPTASQCGAKITASVGLDGGGGGS